MSSSFGTRNLLRREADCYRGRGQELCGQGPGFSRQGFGRMPNLQERKKAAGLSHLLEGRSLGLYHLHRVHGNPPNRHGADK